MEDRSRFNDYKLLKILELALNTSWWRYSLNLWEIIRSLENVNKNDRVVGDTFMRSQETGADEPFQFIINKAKVLSNVTITLEAEGDPSTRLELGVA